MPTKNKQYTKALAPNVDLVGLFFFLWKMRDAIEASDLHEAKRRLGDLFQCIPHTKKSKAAQRRASKLYGDQQAKQQTLDRMQALIAELSADDAITPEKQATLEDLRAQWLALDEAKAKTGTA